MPAGTDRPIYLRAIKPLDTSGGFFYALCLACVGGALGRRCNSRWNRLLHCADPA